MRSATHLIELLELTVTPEQRAAILELESRGLALCYHFGYLNAQEVLEDMNRSFDLGILDEWMTRRVGIGGQ